MASVTRNNISQRYQNCLIRLIGYDSANKATQTLNSLTSISSVDVLNCQTLICRLAGTSRDLRQLQKLDVDLGANQRLTYLESGNKRTQYHVMSKSIRADVFLQLRYFKNQSDQQSRAAIENYRFPVPRQLQFNIPESRFIRASAESFQLNGQIKEILPGLHVSQRVSRDQKILYFAREALPLSVTTKAGELSPFFQCHEFYLQAPWTAFEMHGMMKYQDYESELMLFKGVNAQDVVQQIERHAQGDKSELEDLLYKICYAGSSSMLGYRCDVPENDMHVLYASTAPIDDYLFRSPRVATNINEFHEQYQNLVMVLTSSTDQEKATHKGIMKTPLAAIHNLKARFIDDTGAECGLAMALQTFGFAFAKQQELKYVAIPPLQKMFEMLIDYGKTSGNSKAILHGEILDQNQYVPYLPEINDSNEASGWKKEHQLLIDLNLFQNALWQIQ